MEKESKNLLMEICTEVLTKRVNLQGLGNITGQMEVTLKASLWMVCEMDKDCGSGEQEIVTNMRVLIGATRRTAMEFLLGQQAMCTKDITKEI